MIIITIRIESDSVPKRVISGLSKALGPVNVKSIEIDNNNPPKKEEKPQIKETPKYNPLPFVLKEFKCAICGNTFRSKRPKNTCSQECLKKFRNEYQKIYQKNHRKKANAKKFKEQTCKYEHCKQKFIPHHHNQDYCTDKCRKLAAIDYQKQYQKDYNLNRKNQKIIEDKKAQKKKAEQKKSKVENTPFLHYEFSKETTTQAKKVLKGIKKKEKGRVKTYIKIPELKATYELNGNLTQKQIDIFVEKKIAEQNRKWNNFKGSIRRTKKDELELS